MHTHNNALQDEDEHMHPHSPQPQEEEEDEDGILTQHDQDMDGQCRFSLHTLTESYRLICN